MTSLIPGRVLVARRPFACLGFHFAVLWRSSSGMRSHEDAMQHNYIWCVYC
uniref:Uncharacterized protein n=1 Tax=Arundo donax TaxID=35708 RepID=A0A0A9EM63_ARUDO